MRDNRSSTRVNLDARVITEGGEILVETAEQLGQQLDQGETDNISDSQYLRCGQEDADERRDLTHTNS